MSIRDKVIYMLVIVGLLRRVDDRPDWQELTGATLHQFVPLRLVNERNVG